MQNEIRSLSSFGKKTELRATQTDNEKHLSGYAIVYDEPGTVNDFFGSYREYVRPGALAKTLQENQKIKALFNHNTNSVLGSVDSQTLKLRNDSKGLFFDVTLPDTTTARDLWTSVERGDISECSFSFRTIKDNWYSETITDQNGNDAEIEVRELLEIQLIEISMVPWGAYDATSVQARSLNTDVDFGNVFEILHRSEKGLQISKREHEIINRAIEQLRQVSEPQQHSEATQEPNFSLLRKNLDLLEL